MSIATQVLDKGTKYKSKTRVRALRHLRKTAVRLRTNPKDRIGACGLPAVPDVELINSSQGSTFKGLWSCDSVHTCAVCASKIQARRTKEIANVIGAKGRWSIYLTLTLSHSRKDDLKSLLKELTRCWNRLRNGTFGRRAKKYGMRAFVRAVDLTFSKKSGWHPHYAIVLVFDNPPSPDQVFELKELAYTNWKKSVAKEGREVNRGGFYFETLTNPDDTAAYLAKINSIAWDVGSNTFKQACNGHLNIWQILDLAENSSYFTKIWRDYTKDIKGTRAIHRSKKWKDLVEELEEELIPEEEPKVVLRIRSDLYKHIRKLGDDDRVLMINDRALEGHRGAQMILQGIRRISTLMPVDDPYSPSFKLDYERRIWEPLHNQLSLFCDPDPPTS
jgi:hypothetical protein